VDVGVDLTGHQDLVDRLDHAHAGLLDLTRTLETKLTDATPPTLVFDSPTLRARLWGPADVWQLPAGGWLVPVKLPDPLPELEHTVQQLLDG
jgi:hypothetical protein